MKKIIFSLLLLLSVKIISQVHTSYLWHLQQPIYWPDKSLTNPFEYQKVWESNFLKNNGGNVYADRLVHPLNNLEEIFGKADRVNAYQWETKNAINSIKQHSNAGAQVNYGACLIENMNSLAEKNALGYVNNWQNNIIEAQNWKTSGGFPRMDITGFSWHHVLSPLVSDRVLKKEIQGHRYIVQNNFASNYSKGYWPAECSFSERIIQVLVEEGFEWSIVANSHLARTLNDYPNLNFGTSGVNSNPPNKADKVSTNGINWWSGQIDGRGGAFAAPYSYQAHKAKYVNPETGIEYKITVVPMADLLSYKDGFSEQSTGDIDTHIAPFSESNHPSIVLLAHDGDNAWGGGASYYQEAVRNFTNAAANKGYTPNTIQQFLFDNPAPENSLVKVEDGSWINAENDWGSPQFINWLWPLFTSNFEFDPNGWTEDARNWAVLTAAENYVIMSEDLEGISTIENIVHPTSNSKKSALAWNALLPGFTSGYMYYGKSIDMEVKPTIASNNAISYAKEVIDANQNIDNTKPSVFIPQRYPYNPGEIGFGPTYGYKQHLNSADFTVWTFAYDVSGIQTAELKFRVDKDGKNPLENNDNDTYLGGESVENWQSVSMTEKVFPMGNITNDAEINFFILPTSISNLYYAKIQGLSEVLVDYYVEITDIQGNMTKSKIQHVWVGKNLDVAPKVSFTPENSYSKTAIEITISAEDSKDLNPIIYYTLDGSTPTINSNSAIKSVNKSISETTTFKAFAIDNDSNKSEIITKTYTIGEIPNITVYFKPPSNWLNTPKIYWWNAAPDSSLPSNPWPGISMQTHDNEWYKHTFTGITSINIIFNNGNGGQENQTEDITNVTHDLWYQWGTGVLSLNQNKLITVKVYPNPAVNFLRIDSDFEVDSYQIYDALGKIIQQGIIENKMIDISNLINRLYFLKFKKNTNVVKTFKFIK